MAAYLLDQIPARQTDDNGNPVPGARLNTYQAGTSTPLPTYTDASGSTPHTNPIQADADGYWPPIWILAQSYKLAATEPDATPLWQRDNVATPVGLLAQSDGAAYVGFIQPGTGAIARTALNKMRETINVADYSTTAAAIARATAADLAVRFDVNTTIQIPSDAATIQNVVDHCLPGRLGVVITINIESGHQLATGTIVKDGDYSCFVITSTDPTVSLAPGFPANTCVMEGRRARMPTWSIMLDCVGQSVGGNDGYNLGAIAARENSDLYIPTGAGVTNNGSLTCAGIIIARGSRLVAFEATFTDCAFRNMWITHVSQGYAEECDFSGAGGANVFVSRASEFYGTGGDFSNSGEEGVLSFRSIVMMVAFGPNAPQFNNCGTYAILAQQASRVICRDRAGFRPVVSGGATGIRLEGGSHGDLNGIDFSDLTAGPAIQLVGASFAQARDCTYDNIAGITLASDNGSALDAADGAFTDCVNLVQAQGGVVVVNNSTSSGTLTGTAVYALNGGTVMAIAADFQNAGIHGINCESGGQVYAASSNFTNATVHCVRCAGGMVDASNMVATSAGANGIACSAGGFVNANGGNFSGAVTNGISATTGSKVNACSANAQKGGGPTAGDCVIATGSIVSFNGGTGGVSTAVNTLTAAGIIFQ